MLKRIFTIVLLLPFWLALHAHDLYLLPDSFHVKTGALLKVGFHNGDSFPESEVAPQLARLQDAQLIGQNGKSMVQNLRISSKETLGTVKIPGMGSFLLSVRTVPNLIELAPDKFLDYLKEEGLSDVIEWRAKHQETGKPGRERYTKYAKSLLQSGSSDAFYQHSLGFPIEIIPLADPYTLQAGGTLPVLVMSQGKPAAGLQLEAAWAFHEQHKTIVIGRTDADGNISVPIAKAGIWRFHTLRMERCMDTAVADWESSWASLTFEVR